MLKQMIYNYYYNHIKNDYHVNISQTILNYQRLDKYLISIGLFKENNLFMFYDEILGLHHDRINIFNINKRITNKLSIDWMKEYVMIPFDEKEEQVNVLIDDPFDLVRIQLLSQILNKKVIVFYQAKDAILDIISMQSMNIDVEQSTDDLKIDKLIDSIVVCAEECKASDMHFDINEQNVKLNYRIDGTLVELMNIDRNIYHQLLTKIKILSNMDVTVTLYPQDGHFHHETAKVKFEIRTSTIPTIDGERLALRFLNERKGFYDLSSLGMLDFQIENLKKALNGTGIILVTGPTGSGKTTTLYAILDYLRYQNKNIMTIEDPIERRMEGVTQISLQMMDYPKILKSIVRQDPDIIMLGEIRDGETAEMVVKLAQTGHLIIATVHSSTSIGVISRLINFGISKYLIEDTVKLIIAQRLIRKKCQKCQDGCETCYYTGYNGRQLIVEELTFDTKIKELLYHENYQSLMEKYFYPNSFQCIVEYYLQNKLVTKDELIRVGLGS